jgi:hypothetical protein
VEQLSAASAGPTLQRDGALSSDPATSPTSSQTGFPGSTGRREAARRGKATDVGFGYGASTIVNGAGLPVFRSLWAPQKKHRLAT